ncbi:MAG TPA: DNA mismatch repair protein MutL, partial [Lachnospiraceae bacterium]|nr:DNA mismatch repair protein MutL [Lachnospiraceae bacterium]
GKPELARSNRNFEVYYVNQRYIKSSLISKALDEAYKPYLMLHKYPLVVLYLTIPFHMLDINVHPSKMELRFLESEKIYRLLIAYIQEALSEKELIPEIKEETAAAKSRPAPEEIFPEPFEINRREEFLKSTPVVQAKEPAPFVAETPVYHTVKPEQLNLFEEKFLTENSRKSHRIIGQVFDTYWLIEMEDKLYIIDQHAAHEKVKYERLLKQVRENAVISQFLNPPSIFSLSKTEEQLLLRFLPNFEKLSFEIEHFGGSEYSLRAVPTELFQLSVEDYFHELLDELSQEKLSETLPSINDRLATMACKSAVKGNNRLSGQEAQTLIDELLTLDNPYHCPHGRPTIISYSKYELEKKFKRIV